MNWPLETLYLKHKETGASALDLFLTFLENQKLSLYEAQEEAILELSDGKNVILNTPTGSGKSLVAAFLHFHALIENRKSIYTCPIKALVNEKFLTLCKDFGPEKVGMITGDATVNPDAPIICCTAEILSNFSLRQGEETPYQDIIMDEFHYYSDRDRGVAWQIPLLTLKKSRFLLMSATLGDTQFFEDALTKLNQAKTVTIKSAIRPVPLDFEYSERPLHFKISDLIAQKKTPIYLVNFTQRECAEEAQNLLSVDFCTKEEKKLIHEQLEGIDFKSPYGKEVQKLLKHGIGLHHAGLLPRYRVLVEKLAQKGLLKIICGTDTLGVGVNVPIRTVLFTKLCKYDGEKTSLLSVRDFKQISGRAGRKGFDSQGSVVVQAPEHTIENLILEQKAASDPKKAKKLVKRKPPEKGFLPWNKDTLTKLIEGEPEALTSRFKVDHAMVLNVLSRPGTQNCRALKNLIESSHDSLTLKKKHKKHAFALFRSLYDREIISLKPLKINVDLQEDFSLNHALSLYLIDTLNLLEKDALSYPLDLLTLAESIIENPDLILRRQVDYLKTIRMQEMKQEGMDYDERIEALEKIEHPKPNADFIYATFNEFSKTHPWVGQENIRPKSIAREMFETFQSFHEYIREYNLERVEGLLLRYLSEVYKILIQTVPLSAQTDDVISMIEYFREMLKSIDSSLVDEWEKLRNPGVILKSNTQSSEQNDQKAIVLQLEKNKRVAIRNEVYRVIRLFIQNDFQTLAPLISSTESYLTERAELYFQDHEQLMLDQKARAAHYTHIRALTENEYEIVQTLCDSEEYQDWHLKFVAKTELNERSILIKLNLIDMGPT